MSPPVEGGAATTGSGRVGNLDVLRAVAAFGVLTAHAYSLGPRTLFLRADQLSDVLLLAAAAGVYLFFALSGYVIAKPFIDRLLTGRPLPDLVPYALRRAFRIFPLYWIALTAVIVVAGAGATRIWHYPIHYGLLHNLVPGREGAIFSVAWTLTLEVLFYIAVPLLALVIRRWRPNITPERLAALVLLSAAVSMAFTVLGDVRDGDKIGLWLRGSLLANWQFFCPGLLLAIAPHLTAHGWRQALVELPRRRGAVIVAAVLLAGAALLSSLSPLRYGIPTFQLIADASRPLFAAGFGIVVAYAIDARPVRSRRVLHLGLISYGIYLLHAVLAEFLHSDTGRSLLPLADTGGVSGFAVHFAYLSFLTVIVASVSWRWLEQPLIEYSRRLGDRWRRRRGSPDTPAAAGEVSRA